MRECWRGVFQRFFCSFPRSLCWWTGGKDEGFMLVGGVGGMGMEMEMERWGMGDGGWGTGWALWLLEVGGRLA